MSNLFGGTPLPGRFDKVEKADLTGVAQAATTMNVRDREMRRRFERAENMRRDDINEAAGYDLASIGQFGSEIFQQEVDEVTQLIASGQLNPTQARAKLGELKSLYNQFNTHAEAMSTEDAVANKLATDPQARAARNEAMGIGEELSYGLDDYAAQHNLALNQVFVPGSAQKGDDGTWTVEEPTTGRRVPFSQVKGFADPSAFYQYGVKAVDVGTLGDWAQDNSTSSAIAFEDGTWSESGARDFYRDNVLTTDDLGRTHRLQLLGTLEDRGVITHLTDEQKRLFRDGQDLDSYVFKQIIKKGEDEFVDRSRFDGIFNAKGKGGRSSGRDEGFSDNVIRGGYAVPVGQDVNVTNTGAGSGPSQPYNVNRLTTPITMSTGLATASGNTQTTNPDGSVSTIAGPSDDGSYKITGAGYSPDGRLVAMVSTEVTTMEPEFGYDEDGKPQGQMVETSRTVNKPIYLTDLNGEPPTDGTQELEIYNTVTQNPDLGPVLRDDRVRRSQGLLQDLSEQNPNAGTSTPTYTEGTDNETMDRNVNIGADIMQGLPEDVQADVRAVQDRVKNEEGDVVILPRIDGDNVVFFDKQGRRRNDLGTVALRSQGPAQRGEDAPASLPTRDRQQDQGERGLQGGTREVASTPQAEAPTLKERREAKKKDRIEQLEGRGPSQISQEERDLIGGKREVGQTPRAEAPEPEEVEEARREVTQEEDKAFWGDVREKSNNGENFWGTDLANDSEPFSGDGVNTVTDERSLGRAIEEFGNPPTNSPYYDIAKEKGLLRGLTDEDIREMYETRVARQEGYRADGIVINVPAKGDSGVTIAGLDIGNAAGGSDVKIDIIAKYVDDPKQIEALRKLKGLERDEADAALKEMQAQGLLTRDALGFTQEDLDSITADYGERSYKDFVKKVGSEKELRNLPPDVVEGMLDVHFNVPGSSKEGPGNPLPELARVLKKKPIKKDDVEKLAQKYDNYWGTEDQVAEKLENDSISESNVRRTAEAARRLREFGQTLS